ncbi:putative HTH transcriptional regulator [Oxalobacteraceae bacterium GrIS 1.11]
MNSMLWSDSISEFLRQAVNALTARNLVSLDGTDYKMTAAAMLFLDVDPEAAAIIPATIVGPRYQVERQALDVARHCRRPLMREGALAFRDIPSLLGNERVAHGEMAGDRATGGRQR